MSQFDKLMQELNGLQADQELMTKALPADDGEDEEKIQAAAAEGGSDHQEPDGDEDGEGEGDGDADNKPMAKSFKFTLEDGTEVEAEDGTELVKSLQARVETTEQTMAKALEQTLNLVKGQSELIKSMQDQIKKLSGEGRGRKTVVSVVEKPVVGTMVKSMQPEGVSPDEFFAKALTAQREGRISGSDIALAETMLNRGQQIPPAILQRVMQ